MKKLLSLFLAFVIALGLLPTGAFAADSVEAALGEVNIYNGDYELGYLSINGTVRKQIYTYFLYEANDGTTKEAPAYCVNPNQYGVPQTVGPGESIKYLAEEKSSDPKVVGIISNGYPHRSLGELNLDNKYQAYYATKMALWCYLLPNWSINNLKVAPGLTGSELDIGNRILAAAKDIYQRGTTYNYMLDPRMTVTADKSTAYPVTIDGQEYKQQVFTVWSETWVYDYDVSVAFSAPSQVPEGTKIVDMDNNEITAVTTEPTGDGYSGQFKILYPLESVAGQTGSVQLSLSAPVAQYAAMYAVCQEKDQYGNLQNYICDLDNNVQLDVAAISNYADSPEDEPPDTGLKIIKLEAGTENPLEGAIFSVAGPDGEPIGSFSTNAEGEILIPLTLSGLYTVTEEIPSRYHLLPEEDTQQVTVRYGETAEVTFWNEPYGELRVVKVDADTGDELYGARIQIKHIESGATYTGTTDTGGSYTFTELKPGAYEIVELTAPEGWERDPQTYTTTVVTGDCVEYTIKNEALPGLKIIKYDRESHETMSGVTFRIWRDGELLGDYETDALGEITLTNCTPGTYLVQEVDTGDSGHLVDSTPQEIELSAGDGVKPLYFFNDRKPGIYLVKVDSADPSKVIPNAKFSIEAVDGSFGPAEFTTDQNGEIDLSELEPGAYVVTELECPGYIIDQAQRIIQLEANQTAEFVFTNTIKPSLHLVKLSADGSPLAGVTFRIAKIEDGTHYLDRTTNEQGKILISDLEPGVYSIKETSTVANHLIDPVEHHVELFPGKTSTIILENQKRPSLTIHKSDADTGAPVAGAVFTVKAADGSTINEVTTGPDGTATLENLLPIVYEVTEKSVPEPYLLDAPSQLITLYPNRDSDIFFENHKKPTLTIHKVDSITGNPIEGAKFQVWYGSNSTTTGELNDLGTHFTDERGEIVLEGLRDGWYKVTELEPAHGFTIKEPATQEIYIEGGESKSLTFENVPLNAIVVHKTDSVTGEALAGATFQLRYLGGASGTGGTVIGQKTTGANGMALWTGLEPGSYIVEEIDPADGYSILQSSETVYLADNGEQSVITVHFENLPDGNLLIRKVCSVNPSVTLPDAEFKITYADGSVIGDSNGIFVTDENGEIRINGLEPGKSVIVTETRAPDGYEIDTQSQTIQIQAGRTVSLTFKNEPRGALIIQKRDRVTGQPLAGAQFRVTTASGCEVGLDGVIGDSTLTQAGIFETDANGEIRISNLTPGAYVLTELQAPEGYTIDNPSTNVVIGEGGDTQTVVITNTPKGGLLIKKMDSVTKEPLSDVTFKVTTADGAVVGTSNGEHRTDSNGYISIPDLEPGTYIVQEVQAKSGYLLDDTPKTITVKDHQTYTLEVFNQPKGGLVINKLDSVTHEPLEGVEFTITEADGTVVDDNGGMTSSMGLYRTDENGQIILDGLVGTFIITETKTIEGYTIHEETRTQTVVINPNDTQTITVYNDPIGGVELVKVNSADKTQRIPNVTFEIREMDGALVDTVTTDRNGRVFLPLEDGAYYAVEIESAEGFKLDDTPAYFTVEDGKTTTLQVENEAVSGILIHKTSSTTGEGIYGVTFLLYDDTNTPIGQYTSDNEGYVWIEDLPAGRYYLRELENEGYVLDTEKKTVYVKSGETTEIEWQNTPILGQIQIIKKSANDNPINGLPAGTLLEGAVFEIYDKAGNVVDTIRSDSRGRAVSKLLPLGRYTVREVTAPDYYAVNPTVMNAYLEYEGQIVTFEVENDSVATGVNIKKTGPAQAVSGQPIQYTLTGIGNTSTVPLTSFYWRDALPAQVTLTRIVTGTYNQQLAYKIVYKTNLSGDTYRTLADNLSTTQNYVLDASPTALGLAANEKVTEFMVVFGAVKAGFAQVETPYVHGTVAQGLANNSSFVNVADVGGLYNGQWIMGVSRWVTSVYAKPEPLPRTGY